jgi:cephalosporin-C deacetylase-like acetyl esterase
MNHVRFVAVLFVTPLLELSLQITRVSAHTLSTADRETIYQNTIENYDDPSRDPPQFTSIDTQTFPDYTVEKLTYKSTNGETVPALLCMPIATSEARPFPCLILLHGLRGSKEQMSPVAHLLAELGYASFSIDEYNQGERASRVVTGASNAQLTSVILKGVPQTVVDVRRGIDLLATRNSIDATRIGLLGASLGAIIGTVAAGVDPRIKTTVLISGGGNWGVTINASSTAVELAKGHNRKISRSDQMMLTTSLASADPLTFAPHIAPRSLLIEAGRLDKLIPPSSAQQLYDAASVPVDSHVHIDWYAKGGHIPEPALLVPVVQQWLVAHL